MVTQKYLVLKALYIAIYAILGLSKRSAASKAGYIHVPTRLPTPSGVPLKQLKTPYIGCFWLCLVPELTRVC